MTLGVLACVAFAPRLMDQKKHVNFLYSDKGFYFQQYSKKQIVTVIDILLGMAAFVVVSLVVIKLLDCLVNCQISTKIDQTTIEQ